MDVRNLYHLFKYRAVFFLQPQLDEIVRQCRGRNLFFTTDVQTAVRNADLIFISVGTPTKTKGAEKVRNK